ncbi:MAG: hypothetical protein GY839_04730, partial [candidate division Zixibacteria bacterium]|nr:hypothetical protein [candidate division Zixibacteria bacterium]
MRKLRTTLCITLTALFCLILSSSGISSEIVTAPDGVKYISNEVIVGIFSGTQPLNTGEIDADNFTTGIGSLDVLCVKAGVVKVEKFYKPKLRPSNLKDVVDRMYRFTTNNTLDAREAAAIIGSDGYIRYAETNNVPDPCYEPNDPNLNNQWFISNIKCIQAWDIVRADATEAVVIGIVDTGVYYDHPDLEPNMWINTPEDINGNGIFDNFDEN